MTMFVRRRRRSDLTTLKILKITVLLLSIVAIVTFVVNRLMNEYIRTDWLRYRENTLNPRYANNPYLYDIEVFVINNAVEEGVKNE